MDLIAWIDPVKDSFTLENFPMPCIIRPRALWSGKQLISYLLHEKINLSEIDSEKKLKNINDREGLLILNG